jgi:hypothetical protein
VHLLESEVLRAVCIPRSLDIGGDSIATVKLRGYGMEYGYDDR